MKRARSGQANPRLRHDVFRWVRMGRLSGCQFIRFGRQNRRTQFLGIVVWPCEDEAVCSKTGGKRERRRRSARHYPTPTLTQMRLILWSVLESHIPTRLTCVSTRLTNTALPVYRDVFIDKDGTIAYVQPGPLTTSQLNSILQEILNS